MQITIEIPDELAPQLASANQDLARTALEAMAVEAYRDGRITGRQLRKLLGISTCYEMDNLLEKHQVWLEHTAKYFERERVISEQSRQKQQAELPFENALAQIRGKYAFVRTSVDEFLQRKHEDLELENSQWRQS